MRGELLFYIFCLSLARTFGIILPAEYMDNFSYGHSPVVQLAVGPEEFAPGNYRYHFEVASPETGDFKVQKQERFGDIVKGEYFLVDSSGISRQILYSADPTGFRAYVQKPPYRRVPLYEPKSSEFYDVPKASRYLSSGAMSGKSTRMEKDGYIGITAPEEISRDKPLNFANYNNIREIIDSQ